MLVRSRHGRRSVSPFCRQRNSFCRMRTIGIGIINFIFVGRLVRQGLQYDVYDVAINTDRMHYTLR